MLYFSWFVDSCTTIHIACKNRLRQFRQYWRVDVTKKMWIGQKLLCRFFVQFIHSVTVSPKRRKTKKLTDSSMSLRVPPFNFVDSTYSCTFGGMWNQRSIGIFPMCIHLPTKRNIWRSILSWPYLKGRKCPHYTKPDRLPRRLPTQDSAGQTVTSWAKTRANSAVQGSR